MLLAAALIALGARPAAAQDDGEGRPEIVDPDQIPFPDARPRAHDEIQYPDPRPRAHDEIQYPDTQPRAHDEIPFPDAKPRVHDEIPFPDAEPRDPRYTVP
jgi:hypothetical protein